MGRADASDLIATFQSLYDDLVRLVISRTGDAHRAADIVQEVYLRLVAVQGAQRIANPRSYIFRTARNLIIDEGRRLSRNRQRQAPEEEAWLVSDPQPLPDQTVLARERLRLLDEALRELPHNVRQALLLNRVEGMSQADIARRLGVSESMVVKYVAQALKHCRKRRSQAES